MVDPVEAFTAQPERTIAFEAVFNFRDLGGYPAGVGQIVRWRRLFRADGLNRLRPAEGEQVRALAIRTVIDLRTTEEVATRGRFPADIAHVDYHHLPMFDVMPDWPPDDGAATDYLAERYVEMLESGQDSVVAALGLLARPDAYPVVFHCAAGKDRTGILAALVLGLLGVPDEVIADDYAMSHEAMASMSAWIEENTPDQGGLPANLPPAVLGARPETMTVFLEHLRGRHGSLERAVRDFGVREDEVEALRAHLLEPAPA